MIKYIINDSISSEEFLDILKRSGLSERRPVDKKNIIEKMINNASLIVTARDEHNNIVGIARCVTDYAYCCYLSCLAVDKLCQAKGIGKKLMKNVLEVIGEDCMLLLLSAPGVENYYLNAGFELVPNAYMIKRGSERNIF